MQLPLSASALVMLGVGAVLVGAVILVVEIARRRKPASRSTPVPPDMRMPQQPPAPSAPPADGRVAQPHVPPAEPVAAAPAPEPAAPPGPQPLAAPEPAAPAAERPVPPAPEPVPQPAVTPVPPRPVEVSAQAEPPAGDDRVPPPSTPAAGIPAVPARHHQAGSGRTVAAAVAQAFAVRAAASRAGAATQRRVDPPRLDEAQGAADGPSRDVDRFEPTPSEGVDAAAQSGDQGVDAAARTDPEGVDHAARTGGEGVDAAVPNGSEGVDPAATTDPDGAGLAAMATPEPDDEVRAPAGDEPAPDASGSAWAAPVAHGVNGDHPAGVPERAGDVEGVGSGGEAPAAVAAAGLAAAAWAPPAASGDPEPADVPTPRPDEDGAAQQHGPAASDARDRLLAVLLDDPERAVGATVELESCLRELDRLSDAVRSGRAALRDVLQRLAAAGLRPDQMARLARMPLPEVEALLNPAPAEQQA